MIFNSESASSSSSSGVLYDVTKTVDKIIGYDYSKYTIPIIGYSVAYLDGTYLLGGRDGWIYRSTDGVNYTQSYNYSEETSGENPPNIIVYNNTFFVCSYNRGYSGVYHYSADGITFYQRAFPSSVSFIGWFISSGWLYVNYLYGLYRSQDGISWEAVSLPNTYNYQTNIFACEDKIYFSYRYLYVSSGDSISWSNIGSALSGGDPGVAKVNGRYYIVYMADGTFYCMESSTGTAFSSAVSIATTSGNLSDNLRGLYNINGKLYFATADYFYRYTPGGLCEAIVLPDVYTIARIQYISDTDEFMLLTSSSYLYLSKSTYTYTGTFEDKEGNVLAILPLSSISIGQYTGTGTSGSSGYVTISADFPPKVVIIRANSGQLNYGLTLIQGQTTATPNIISNSLPSDAYITANWVGNSVQFYASSAKYMMNSSGIQYNYAIFG